MEINVTVDRCSRKKKMQNIFLMPVAIKTVDIPVHVVYPFSLDLFM